MSADPLPSYTFDEFLAAARFTDQRQEFVGGRVYAMTGATERHDLLTQLAFQSLWAGARQRGCRAFIHNRLVRLGDAGYSPDIVVSCGPASHDHYETDLTIAVETLSPSTASTDRREKSLAYSKAPSFEIYVILDPNKPVAEVARLVNGWLSWETYGPGSVVETSVGSLDLDELHGQLDQIATT